MNRTALFLTIVAAFALSWAAPRSADAGPNAFGIRGGVTSRGSNGFFGFHGAIHLSGARRLRLEPSLEALIDQDVDDLSMRFNLNFKYLIPLGGSAAVYPIFGPEVTAFGNDGTGLGANLGFGFGVSGFLFDFVVTFGGGPNLTFTLGYTFW